LYEYISEINTYVRIFQNSAFTLETMDAPPEGNIDAESCNEIDDDKSNSDCQEM